MNNQNNGSVLKFLSYVIVGGLATVVEWVCYWLFSRLMGLSYLPATAAAIVVSTFSNWLFGRLITFRNAPAKHLLQEIIQIYLASIVGLVLNMFLMWLLFGQLHINDMVSKIIATGIVFIYNYLIRILVIYKSKESDK